MIRKYFFLTVLLLVFFQLHSFGSHLMGGEITWECLSTGEFKFKMKVYRDCSGIPFGGANGIYTENICVTNHPTLTQITMTQIAKSEISPTCNIGGQSINCANPPTSGGAVEEYLFESLPISISGTPPPAGWVFSWSTCCRNSAIQNLSNAGFTGFTLRAIMFPYNGKNTGPCYDNSPDFLEKPTTVIPTGYPFSYNHNANDKDLDSIKYDWGGPLNEANPFTSNGCWPALPILFQQPYTTNNPLPGTPANKLNTATGEISFLTNTQGSFITCIRVTSFRCGIKIAEIYRELQIVLLNGTGNSAPTVPPPQFIINGVANGTPTYTKTVKAGSLIEFALTGTDIDPGQNVSIEATGIQFGNNQIDPLAGCLKPPCATLTATTPNPNAGQVAANFKWQTECDHINYLNSCNLNENTYTFVIKVKDDFCPVPAINFSTIRIRVVGQKKIKSPELRCIEVLPNGNPTLSWKQPDTTNTDGSFNEYVIYRSTTPSGPYTALDSIQTWSVSSYTDLTANANLQSYYYYIKTKSACHGNIYADVLDTAATLLLDATVDVNKTYVAHLKWNALITPKPATNTGVYKIYRYYHNTWSLIGTTAALTFIDSMHICASEIKYRIEMDDALPCTSVSNSDSVDLVDANAVLPTIKAPSLRCASVNKKGYVDLSWIASTDTLNSFYAYTIYRSTSLAGPYTLIDSILSINQTNYTDSLLGVNAQLNSYFYFINVWSGCGSHLVSVAVDTLKTIKLNVTPIQAAVADLSWNSLTTPNLPSSVGIYTIYREYPVGTWLAIGTTTSLKYLDTISICNASLNYKVTIADQSGCSSSSSLDGGIFKDLTKPNTPVLDSVSVDLGTGAVQMGWSPSSSADAVAYIIYYFNGTSFVAIDTVNSATNRYYLDNVQNPFAPNNNPAKALQVYCIAALDSCNNVSLLSQYQQSIFLKVVSNQCDYENNLDWTPYVNWSSGVSQYDILVSKDAAPFVFIGSVSGSTTSFVHSNLDKGSTYCYLVRAHATNASFTALSNTACVKMLLSAIPQFVYVSHATVLEKNKIEVRFLTDTVANAQGYNVKKSLYDNGPFEQLSYIPYSYPNPLLTITDKDVLTDSLNYVYNVTVIDSCGNEAVSSNIGKTILLRARSEINLINVLNWSEYKNFDAGVAEYQIFRSVEGVSTKPIYIASVPGIITSYEDNVAEFKLSSGNFCYFVRAMENLGNQYQLRDSSTSNVACTKQEPTVYIPNAFYPLSDVKANRTFKPISMFIAPDGYQFAIFDRWGRRVFYTEDPEMAWDGKPNGTFAGTSVFVYTVKYKDIYGSIQLKSGTVTLIE